MERLYLHWQNFSMLNDNSPTKLIIEIKSHSSSKRNYAAADSTLLLVQRMGLEDKVEYISFSMDVCKELVKMDPSARVAYLSGGLSPQELYQDGITGIDYKMANYRDNPNGSMKHIIYVCILMSGQLIT